MKLLVFADNHFCEKCSIISGYGTKYSLRLENQIESINWIEEQAVNNNCAAVICLGDFFDKPQLSDQEITALRDISWSAVPHFFIVGNHESERNNLQYSSTKALEAFENYRVISSPETLLLEDSCELGFLPYIVECDRQPLEEYFKPLNGNKRIIFSHNDLCGIQMGPVISRTGFIPEDFTKVCQLCLNGHLHNGQKITETVINLGNLTGRDFGEDATKYAHKVAIVDTETLGITYIENPFAFNFYKLDIFSQRDLVKLTTLKTKAVLSIRCEKALAAEIKDAIKALGTKVIESRLIATHESTDMEVDMQDISSLTVDHHTKFAECCREKIGSTPVLESELAEILK